ncbi:unnamed protein product, partial [Staurois parvus]
MPLVPFHWLFHRLFWVWAETQGSHDPLLPGGPHELSVRPWSLPIFVLMALLNIFLRREVSIKGFIYY